MTQPTYEQLLDDLVAAKTAYRGHADDEGLRAAFHAARDAVADHRARTRPTPEDAPPSPVVASVPAPTVTVEG